MRAEAKRPVYSHRGDAGLDLFSCEDLVLEAGEARPVPTGIKMAIPEGHVGLVWDKSGISLKAVHRLAGVIDAGYRGGARAVLFSLGREPLFMGTGRKAA